MKMPKKFMWGCASAACQMEGGFQEDQKSLSIADIDYFESGEKSLDRKDDKTYLHTIHQILENQSLDFPKRRGNDFYHHYKEDIALLADMGIHAYRFSIAWTRIFPNPDDEKPNAKGLQFYDHVVDECLKYNIEPVITLSHFDTPLLIATKYGGWSDKAVIPLFQKYCKVVFYHFKRRVKYWISFNEINAALEIPFTGSALIYQDGDCFESKKHQALYNQLFASSLITRDLKQIDPNAYMGCMVASFMTYPETCNPLDVYQAMKENRLYYLYLDVQVNGAYPNWYRNELLEKGIIIQTSQEELDVIRNYTVDYISFSYYMSFTATHETGRKSEEGNLKGSVDNPFLSKTNWGWSIDPLGLRITMNEIYDRYHKPLLISENGIGAYDTKEDHQIHDPYRIDYLSKHIEELIKAIQIDGVECFGYLSWSPIDMISAGTSEMSKRYGFIYVDQDNQGNGTKERIRKDSFYWYKQFIQDHSDILEKSNINID